MTDALSAGSLLPDDIDQHPAGPELDALLAERVLRARLGRYRELWSGYENWIATTPDGAELFIMVSPHTAYGAVPLWNPSTNVEDAQALVQHWSMRAGYRPTIEEGAEEQGYTVTLSAQRPVDHAAPGAGARPPGPPQEAIYSATGTAPTRALALCRALYKAASAMRPREPGGDNG